MLIPANKGKHASIDIEGTTYFRLPIKTHTIGDSDNLYDIARRYIIPHIQKDDVVVISERVVSIMEGRSYLLDEIKPGLAARVLSGFVEKNPYGIGLKSPHTMQLAIDEVGLLRILVASAAAFFTKPLGLKGVFYKVAGHNINAIDGPCDYTLPPGNTSAKLPPKNPKETAQELARFLKTPSAIIDANDLGVCILGASRDVDMRCICSVFKDNPMGQAHEKTPIIIVRKKH